MTTEQATGQAAEQTTDSMMPDSIVPADMPAESKPSEAMQRLLEPVRTKHSDLWKIFVHNDAVTPYEYVINILGDLFMLSEELADHVAWTAHTKGVAVVVVRPRAEAEKLVKVAHGRARQVSYPLTFTIEQE